MRILTVILAAIVVAVGTWFGGWLAVPLCAAVYAAAQRTARAPGDVAVAASLAWAALLVRLAPNPAFGRLISQLGQIFPAPGVGVALLAIVLAATLAFTAARVSIGVLGVRE